jgi:hypothetical protein
VLVQTCPGYTRDKTFLSRPGRVPSNDILVSLHGVCSVYRVRRTETGTRRAEGRAVEEEVVGEEVSERVRIIGWSWMSLSSSLRKAGHCQSFVRLFSRPGTTPKAEVESIMEPGPGLSHRATRQSNSKRGRSRWRGEERSEVVGGGRMNRMGRGGEHWQAIGSDRLPFDLVGSAKRLLRSPS